MHETNYIAAQLLHLTVTNCRECSQYVVEAYQLPVKTNINKIGSNLFMCRVFWMWQRNNDEHNIIIQVGSWKIQVTNQRYIPSDDSDSLLYENTCLVKQHNKLYIYIYSWVCYRDILISLNQKYKWRLVQDCTYIKKQKRMRQLTYCFTVSCTRHARIRSY